MFLAESATLFSGTLEEWIVRGIATAAIGYLIWQVQQIARRQDSEIALLRKDIAETSSVLHEKMQEKYATAATKVKELRIEVEQKYMPRETMNVELRTISQRLETLNNMLKVITDISQQLGRQEERLRALEQK
jgi:hypothetical protein